MISKLENMFKDYQNQKHKRQAKADQMKVIKKTVNIIVPIAIAVALTIIVFAKYKSKKLLKEQQEEADRVLKKRDKLHTEAIETERQNYRMQQAAISSRLKHKSQEVRELKDQIKQVEILTTKTETANNSCWTCIWRSTVISDSLPSDSKMPIPHLPIVIWTIVVFIC